MTSAFLMFRRRSRAREHHPMTMRMETKREPSLLLPLFLLFVFWSVCAEGSDKGEDNGISYQIFYDDFASTECEVSPREALYKGGIVVNPSFDNGSHGWSSLFHSLRVESPKNCASYLVAPPSALPSQPIQNSLKREHKYSLSAWAQIRGDPQSALVRASVVWKDESNKSVIVCAGTVIARPGCWSFLKGGFVPDSDYAPFRSILFFQTNSTEGELLLDSVSLQPFTDEQWRSQQKHRIDRKRKRRVIVHVSDVEGNALEGAQVTLTQKSWEFPFGSAVAYPIWSNKAYQRWFVERFNTAVLENELKWYWTEAKQGSENYSAADAMVKWCMSMGIGVRGHNIFWEDPRYIPAWLKSLRGAPLHSAVLKRIRSLVDRYAGKFLSWDVSNELLHFSFYEDRLGPNASAVMFDVARQHDPWTPMFMNDYNVIETCHDSLSTVDSYIAKLRDFMASAGAPLVGGIGLESHFSKPNIPLMRAILDKLGTVGLPVWLTEIDVSNSFDPQTQAVFLEEILREGFSHPAVEGMVMWTALHPGRGCYQMCLTDDNLNNLPAGSTVDTLIAEWSTKVSSATDRNGCVKFDAFRGSYLISASANANATFKKRETLQHSISSGSAVQHIYIQL